MFDSLKNLIKSERTITTTVHNNNSEPITTTTIIPKNNLETIPEEIQDDSLDKTQKEALKFFDNIYGLDDVKETVYLTITSPDKVNRLLVGPPAGAKTIFGMTITKKMKNWIYFDAANMSGAGFIETLITHKTAEGLVIDEIDKLNKKDLNCLLGLLATGQVTKTLKDKRVNFEMNVRVIATSNSTKKLSPPILSRFMKTVLPEYSDQDFIKVAEFCLKDKLPAQTAHMIADILLQNHKKDIRTVMGISAMIRRHHTYEDIQRIITTHLKYDNEELVDFN